MLPSLEWKKIRLSLYLTHSCCTTITRYSVIYVQLKSIKRLGRPNFRQCFHLPVLAISHLDLGQDLDTHCEQREQRARRAQKATQHNTQNIITQTRNKSCAKTTPCGTLSSRSTTRTRKGKTTTLTPAPLLPLS